MISDIYKDEIDRNNKNRNLIKCRNCDSIILKSSSSYFTSTEFDLPLPHQKNSTKVEELATEKLIDFWTVDDMFTFENIGFSNTVDDIKYLICADCEMGPVGYHNITTKKNYIALQRVKHEH